MKIKIIFLAVIFLYLNNSNAQNQTINGVAIGIDGPAFGTSIKMNFPSYTGGWARGYSISNNTGSENFIMLGSFGSASNGVFSVSNSFIGKDHTNQYMTFLPSGFIGIGTTTPTNALTVQKVSGGTGLSGSDGKGGVRVNWSSGYGVALDAWDGNEPRWGITSFIANTPVVMLEGRYTSRDVYFNSGGNVGIGTANPDQKLTVKGKIHSEEVIVDLAVTPDYVFQKYYTGKSELKADYKLPTLAEIEDFTKKNHHLPKVPSAATIQEKGLQLGEMSNVLLQKIEELTIYAIEQDKKTIEQQKEIDRLKAQNENYKSLVERVAALEKK